MRTFSFVAALAAVSIPVMAQQVQIPTLQVCNLTGGMAVSGSGSVSIPTRADASHTGTFSVEVKLSCNSSGYPIGSLSLTGISMTDSAIQGAINATTFEQLTSTGAATPTAYLNGRCSAQSASGAEPTPCHYWIMFAHNNTEPSAKDVPDIVSFLVLDKAGHRLAYGTGPLNQGTIVVSPTGN